MTNSVKTKEQIISEIASLNTELKKLDTDFVSRCFFNKVANYYIKIIEKTSEKYYTIICVDNTSVSKFCKNLLELDKDFVEVSQQEFDTKIATKINEIYDTSDKKIVTKINSNLTMSEWYGRI